MNISEGLRAAKKLKAQISELQGRMRNCVIVEKGADNEDNFPELHKQYTAVVGELAELETRIALANSAKEVELSVAGVPAKVPLGFLVRRAAETKGHIKFLKELPTQHKPEKIEDYEKYVLDDEGNHKRVTTRRTMVCTFVESQKRGSIELLQQMFDAMDAAINKANHETQIPDLGLG